MKITKYSNEALKLKTERDNANIGCSICPCCGETNDTLSYIKAGVLNKGIFSGIQRSWVEGFFKMRYMKADCYYCETCGAEWESDPYECK